MRQEVGWSAAVVVAVAAAIGVTSSVNERPSVGQTREAKFPAQHAPRNPDRTNAFAQGPCVEIEERLQSFLINGDKTSIAAPETCFEPQERPNDYVTRASAMQAKSKDLTFVIATVPDPLHTHFSLSFDRLMEAIQQGATDQEYIYDSSWLPWETEQDKFALITDQEKSDDEKKAREEQPGIVLFRKIPAKDSTAAAEPFRRGLVVFVVGEEPTHGVHRMQFWNAAAWMAALQPGRESTSAKYQFPAKIIGPSSSGSLPSLASLLVDLAAKTNPGASKANPPARPTVLIYSGSVTSGVLVNRFLNFTGSTIDAHLWSFQQSDDRALDLYCRFLSRSGFDLDKLAIVSEDETAYGNLFRDQANQPLPCSARDKSAGRFYYPRDISALRSAYQKQSIFYRPAEQSATENSRRTLTPDIADPEGQEHDTIRDYSGDQLALSQEAVLQQIVSQLRVHNSEYVVLRSSNPLDQLFLSQYLRLSYPQGRIVILGADLLLRRETGAARLGGIMTLSTFPLLPQEPHWTRVMNDKVSHAHRVFPHDGTEATYVATRFLLHPPVCDDQNPPRCQPFDNTLHSGDKTRFLPVTSTDPHFHIPDYSTPFWIRAPGSGDAAEPPPVWLSVLGRNDFWPVAALNDRSLPQGHDPSFKNFLCATLSFLETLWPFSARTAFPDQSLPQRTSWPPMPLSMRIAWILLLAWALFHLVCCALPSVMKKPSHRAYFASYEPYRTNHKRLVVLGSLAIASAATVLGSGCGAMSPEGMPLMHPQLLMGLVLLLWTLAAAALVVNIRGESGAREWRWPLATFVLVTAGFYYLLYFSTEPAMMLANRMTTYLRDMNLASGVSPLVPLLAPTVGTYLWFWHSLQGLTLFGPDHPVLPPLDSLEVELPGKKQNWLGMFSSNSVGNLVEQQCIPFAGATVAVAIGLSFVLLALAEVIAGDVPIRSLGATSYGILICILMNLCVSILLANTFRLLTVWMSLRELLTFLNRLRLRRSMAAFSGISWGSVWKISGNVLEMRYKVLTRQAECATHLKNALDELRDGHRAPASGPRTFPEVDAALADLTVARKNFAEWYVDAWDNPRARDTERRFEKFQERLARTAGILLSKMLIAAWGDEEGPDPEGESSIDESAERNGKDLMPVSRLDPHIRFAERLVCYVYLGFIQNVLGRLRGVVMGILWLFVTVTVAMASYPFDPRPGISVATVILFLAVGTVIVLVYAQMHRDPILSYLTNTKPGELGIDFWFKLIGFGIGPVIGLLATVFPDLTNFLFAWVQPGISSMR